MRKEKEETIRGRGKERTGRRREDRTIKEGARIGTKEKVRERGTVEKVKEDTL